MMIVMVPLYLLYEVGVILARIADIGKPSVEDKPFAEDKPSAEDKPPAEGEETAVVATSTASPEGTTPDGQTPS